MHDTITAVRQFRGEEARDQLCDDREYFEGQFG